AGRGLTSHGEVAGDGGRPGRDAVAIEGGDLEALGHAAVQLGGQVQRDPAIDDADWTGQRVVGRARKDRRAVEHAAVAGIDLLDVDRRGTDADVKVAIVGGVSMCAPAGLRDRERVERVAAIPRYEV